MADLAELLERVKAASGPDRELDALLWCVAMPEFAPFKDCVHRGDWAVRARDTMGTWFSRSVPPCTASLDAALALVERVLPDLDPLVSRYNARGWGARLDRRDWGRLTEGQHFYSPTPALALLAAMLTALSRAAVGSANPREI